MNDFIFIYGVSVRSGTNFIARIFSKYDEVEVIPRNETTREFPLLKTLPLFESAFKTFAKLYNRNMGRKTDFDWNKFMPFLGEAFLSYMKEFQVVKNNSQLYLLKEPGFNNLDHFFNLFPNAKLVLLLRDGRDVVTSQEKAHTVKHRNQSKLNQFKRHFSVIIGWQFRFMVQAWERSTRKGIDFFELNKDSGSVFLVHYEDLVNRNSNALEELFNFVGIPFNPDLLDDVEIMASSFSDAIGGAKNKVTWKPQQQSADFKPIGRWSTWPAWKKNYFEKVAGATSKRAGY